MIGGFRAQTRRVARTAIRTILCTLFLSSFVYGQDVARVWTITADALNADGDTTTLAVIDSGAHISRLYVVPVDSNWISTTGVLVECGETTLATVTTLTLGRCNYSQVDHLTTRGEALKIKGIVPGGTLQGKLKIVIYITYL